MIRQILIKASRQVGIGVVLVALTGCAATESGHAADPWVAVGRFGMVASDSPYASEAGVEMLRKGGNAIDAAVATSLALGVTRPESTGLGGGGFMILRVAKTGRLVALDFRECAPAASTRDMFARSEDSATPPASEIGGLAVGVPGLLSGQMSLLRRWGAIRKAAVTSGQDNPPALDVIMAPAIRLAEDGFAVDQHYVDACREVQRKYEAFPQIKGLAGYVWQTHLRGGAIRKVGDTLRQPALARTLRLIVAKGTSVFYGGPVGQAVVEAVRQAGGILTLDDLRDYAPRRRKPVFGQYRDYRIIAFPPPSSGGIALAESLNILETVDLKAIHDEDPALAAHWTIEALKHAFSDRARWLGDPDFVDVPMRQLAEKPYGARLARHIRPDGVGDIDRYGGKRATSAPATQAAPAAAGAEDAGTSHFCVVDRSGNCVVWTETINTAFGSLLAADAYGLILNNEMDDFATRPGRPNAFGLIQSEYNAVAPGKRPLSSMSPTIVTRGGLPVLLLGGSGGPRIISSVLQTLLNVVEYQMPVGEAVRAPRFHHQWRPDAVFFDAPPEAALRKGLASRGQHLSSERREAAVQAIAIRPGHFTGASDPRKGGRPAGF